MLLRPRASAPAGPPPRTPPRGARSMWGRVGPARRPIRNWVSPAGGPVDRVPWNHRPGPAHRRRGGAGMGAFSCLGTVDGSCLGTVDGEASVKVEGGGDHALTPDGDGYYSGQVAQIGQDARYQF